MFIDYIYKSSNGCQIYSNCNINYEKLKYDNNKKIYRNLLEKHNNCKH